MLHYEFEIPTKKLQPDTDLREEFYLDDEQFMSLKRPIETWYFADQGSTVSQNDLLNPKKTATPAKLRDLIWDGTP